MANAGFQELQIVVRAGDVVAAAEVEPLHPGQDIAKLRLHGLQGPGKSVGVLLAEGVEVEAVQQGKVRFVDLIPGGAQAGAGGAGIVDGVLLGGAEGIDPKSHAAIFTPGLELSQLRHGIKNDMVAQRDDFIKLSVPVGGGKHVVFLSHLLPP